MSYEPRLLVEKKDLLNIESELDTLSLHKDHINKDYEDSAPKYILHALNHWNPVKLKGKEYFLLSPDGSSFNREVRELLDKFNIEFGIDY